MDEPEPFEFREFGFEEGEVGVYVCDERVAMHDEVDGVGRGEGVVESEGVHCLEWWWVGG